MIAWDKSAYQYILDLLNRADLIGYRIIEPSTEDMKKIRHLYEAGFIVSYTNEYGVPVKRVTGRMDLGSRLGDMEERY